MPGNRIRSSTVLHNKNEPASPYRHYSNDFVDLVQDGKFVILKSLLTEEERMSFRRQCAKELPLRKLAVDRRVSRIRRKISELEYGDLLRFSAKHELMNYIRVGDPEIDESIAYEAEKHPSRTTEFIQSLVVAHGALNGCEKPIGEEDKRFLPTALDIFDEIRGFEEDIRSFLLSWAIAFDESHDDPELTAFVLEAQYMYMVRGDRYQAHQSEYHERLLSSQAEVLEERFSIAPKSLLEGLEKLEYSLSAKSIDAWNGFARLFEEEISNVPFEEGVKPSDEVIEKAQCYMNSMFSKDAYDVEKITGWPTDLINELAFGVGECDWPSPFGEYEFWPITYLPAKRRPFIRLDGRYYCFDYYTLMDNFYRALYWAVCRNDNQAKNLWNKSQQEASEQTTSEILQEILTGAIAFRNFYYPPVDVRGKGNRNECDLLLVYESVAIVVEIKAGAFVYTPPFVDYEAHINSYKKLIQKPDCQCQKASEYLLSFKNADNKKAPLFNKENEVIETIDMEAINDIFQMSVTVDNINAFSSRAERIAFLDLKCGAISIALDDLMVYRDYFSDAEEFLDFLYMRRKASRNERLTLNDEIDHLGMYIAYNDYAEYANSLPDYSQFNFLGFREEFDQFYGKLGSRRAGDGELKIAISDAVVRHYISDNGKPGRNEPCPCGSGRKYKRCHGR